MTRFPDSRPVLEFYVWYSNIDSSPAGLESRLSSPEFKSENSSPELESDFRTKAKNEKGLTSNSV